MLGLVLTALNPVLKPLYDAFYRVFLMVRSRPRPIPPAIGWVTTESLIPSSRRIVARRRRRPDGLTRPPSPPPPSSQVVEMHLVPDFILRAGIRYLLRTKCLFHFDDTEDQLKAEMAFVADLRTRAVAEQTKAANEQHYEVPTEFYLLCLGSNLKYSCCLYDKPGMTLDEAEVAMLELYGERGSSRTGRTSSSSGAGGAASRSGWRRRTRRRR